MQLFRSEYPEASYYHVGTQIDVCARKACYTYSKNYAITIHLISTILLVREPVNLLGMDLISHSGCLGILLGTCPLVI